MEQIFSREEIYLDACKLLERRKDNPTFDLTFHHNIFARLLVSYMDEAGIEVAYIGSDNLNANSGLYYYIDAESNYHAEDYPYWNKLSQVKYYSFIQNLFNRPIIKDFMKYVTKTMIAEMYGFTDNIVKNYTDFGGVTSDMHKIILPLKDVNIKLSTLSIESPRKFYDYKIYGYTYTIPYTLKELDVDNCVDNYNKSILDITNLLNSSNITRDENKDSGFIDFNVKKAMEYVLSLYNCDHIPYDLMIKVLNLTTDRDDKSIRAAYETFLKKINIDVDSIKNSIIFDKCENLFREGIECAISLRKKLYLVAYNEFEKMGGWIK